MIPWRTTASGASRHDIPHGQKQLGATEGGINDPRRVFVVGGTGFLGYYAIQEILKRGWRVTALGLPPAPPPGLFPKEVEAISLDVEQAPDEELHTLLRGHDAIVFAAGVDDRLTPRKPAYPFFYHGNVEIPVRILKLARKAGVRRGVVLGSYFAYFNRLWPEMQLAEHHPYIRSRVEQEKAVTSIPGLDVCVLELPYVFGTPPGKKPLWYPLVKYLRATPLVFFMRGGSACISVHTAAQAIVGAIEHGEAGKSYPLGGENLTWSQLLTRLARADNRTVRVILLPTWLIIIGLDLVWFYHLLQGKETGIDPRHFASLQTAETFLDAEPSRSMLGLSNDRLEDALRETVRACKVDWA